MTNSPTAAPDGTTGPVPDTVRRRRLRAVFAADIMNFGGLVSVDETRTLDELSTIRRIAKEELKNQGGWLFGMPGDGLFALFESAVDAVTCALLIQAKLAGDPRLDSLKMRIGIHLGDVLFQDELPFGEALVIAARLESLADAGGILVSATVMDAVAPRISATFKDRGFQPLKHSPRRIATFSVSAAPDRPELEATAFQGAPLDQTQRYTRRQLKESVARLGTDFRHPRTSLTDPLVIAPASAMAPTPPAPHDQRADSARLVPAAPALQAPPTAAPVSSPGSAGFEAALPGLTQLLTAELGPFARVLIAREASRAPNLLVLIERLAAAIPNATDRQRFVEAARRNAT